MKKILTLLLALCGHVHAEVVLSNFPETEVGGPQITPSTWVGQSFSFTDSDYSLGSIRSLMVWNGGPGALGARIYSESGGFPSAIISELNVSAHPAIVTQYYASFTPQSETILQAGDTYFLVLYGITPGPNTQYYWARSTGSVTGDGAIYSPSVTSLNTGGSWGNYLATPQAIEITATAIPEPSNSAALVGLLASLYFLKRRRR